MTRRGFTLVEVLVGLVVTSLVALIVYGSLSASIDTHARLDEDAAAARSEQAWRALLTTAVRNVRGSVDFGAPTFLLIDGTDADGRPSDRVAFVTAADLPPLTREDDWRVAIHAAGGTLTMVASPVHDLDRTREIRAPDGMIGMSVQALAAGSLGWQDSWPLGAALPHALRVTFWGRQGPLHAPLVLSIPGVVGP